MYLDEEQIAQSGAILAYSAKRAGLYPFDPLEAAKASRRSMLAPSSTSHHSAMSCSPRSRTRRSRFGACLASPTQRSASVHAPAAPIRGRRRARRSRQCCWRASSRGSSASTRRWRQATATSSTTPSPLPTWRSLPRSTTSTLGAWCTGMRAFGVSSAQVLRPAARRVGRGVPQHHRPDQQDLRHPGRRRLPRRAPCPCPLASCLGHAPARSTAEL